MSKIAFFKPIRRIGIRFVKLRYEALQFGCGFDAYGQSVTGKEMYSGPTWGWHSTGAEVFDGESESVIIHLITIDITNTQ